MSSVTEPPSVTLPPVFNPSPAVIVTASSANLDIGRARSGVCGPTICGSSVERSISITRSKYFSGFCSISGSCIK